MRLENYGVSILMPCLNEEKTIRECIYRAQDFLREQQLQGEVLIADNASTDASFELAGNAGARVISVLEQGYGAALSAGIAAAEYEYILMLDADASYDVFEGKEMLNKLDEGYDLVIGNRFKGGIEKGAMPWLHRYIGNPLLSALGRRLSHTNINDFHCGMRAFYKTRIVELDLKTTQMEYASEMIMKAARNNLKITEVPCKLHRDGRSGKSHLRTIRDGVRHVICLWKNSYKEKLR